MTTPAARPPAAPVPGFARRRWLPLAWGVVAFAILLALVRGPGISREEAGTLAAAGAASPIVEPGTAARPVSPVPALLSRMGAALSSHAQLPGRHLVGYRLASVTAGALIAAMVALLAQALAGPAAGALAPALLLCAPRLLLPLLSAGPQALGAAGFLAAALAFRRAAGGRRIMGRFSAALASGVLFGLGLSAQLSTLALLAAAALHALLCPLLRLFRSSPTSQESSPGPTPRPRSSATGILAMAVLGPLIAAALWPWLWADPLHRIASAVSAAPFDTARLFLSRLLHPAHPPWGEPLLTTAMALPVTLVLVFAVGLLHSLLRLFRALLGGPDLSSELFLLLAALSPLAAAQLGFLPRGSGLGPWLPSFPLLSALGARAILSAARTVSASFSGRLAIVLSVATLIPGIAASIHSYPELGASWGEIPGRNAGGCHPGPPQAGWRGRRCPPARNLRACPPKRPDPLVGYLVGRPFGLCKGRPDPARILPSRPPQRRQTSSSCRSPLARASGNTAPGRPSILRLRPPGPIWMRCRWPGSMPGPAPGDSRTPPVRNPKGAAYAGGPRQYLSPILVNARLDLDR